MLRRLGTVGVTFVVAFGSGHLLQSGGLNSHPRATAATIADASITPLAANAPLGQIKPDPSARAPFLPDLPQTVTALPQPGANLAGRVAALDRQRQEIGGPSKARYDDFGKICPRPSLSVTPASDGLMTILYNSPCDPEARLVVETGAITADLATDAMGRAVLSLPVLDAAGRVTVQGAAGGALTVTRPFPMSALPARIIVSSDVADSLSLGTGETLPLGDTAANQAWTQPLKDGAAPILHAMVTPRTCGQQLTARVAILGGTTAPRVADVSVEMPDCGFTGESVLVPLDLRAGEMAAAG